jgi:hypothetical protein
MSIISSCPIIISGGGAPTVVEHADGVVDSGGRAPTDLPVYAVEDDDGYIDGDGKYWLKDTDYGACENLFGDDYPVNGEPVANVVPACGGGSSSSAPTWPLGRWSVTNRSRMADWGRRPGATLVLIKPNLHTRMKNAAADAACAARDRYGDYELGIDLDDHYNCDTAQIAFAPERDLVRSLGETAAMVACERFNRLGGWGGIGCCSEIFDDWSVHNYPPSELDPIGYWPRPGFHGNYDAARGKYIYDAVRQYFHDY